MEKKCFKCGLVKPLDLFYKNKGMKDGHLNKCKVCDMADSITWAKNNPERRKEISRNSAEKHREKNRAKVKEWWVNNPEKPMEYYRKRVADPVKHAGIIKVMADRLARQKNAMPSWSNQFFIREIYELARLRTVLTGIEWHVDHIVPIRSEHVCGLHVWQNLQVIPAKENRVKNNVVWPDMPDGISHRQGVRKMLDFQLL